MKNNQLINPKTGKDIEPKLAKVEWYQTFIEDCQAIIVESTFTSRWALIEGYHQLGKRILEETDNFNREKIYGREITQRVAVSLGKSQRTIEQAIQFAKKYPDLNILPEGKNISWRKIANKYLPAHYEGTEMECNHPESQIEEISFLKCKECGKSLEGHSRILTKEEISNKIENWAKANNFPQFTLEFGEEGKPFIYIPSGEENWKGYLKKNPFPEVWKLLKKIEDKR